MDLSRRELLFFRLGRAPELAPSTPAPPPFLRPPGALPEARFREACTSCDACITACPRDAVRRAGWEHGPEVEGTPVILVDKAPCWLCPDLPCIDVCEPRALEPLASPADARMGTLVIRDGVCFSERGSPCEVCVERCPVRPRPISVSVGEAPEVDVDACTGCGVCAYLCPADALDVEPVSAVRSRA